MPIFQNQFDQPAPVDRTDELRDYMDERFDRLHQHIATLSAAPVEAPKAIEPPAPSQPTLAYVAPAVVAAPVEPLASPLASPQAVTDFNPFL